MNNGNDQSLDYTQEEFEKHLHDAIHVIGRLYDGLERKKVFQSNSVAEVKSLFDEPLPDSPTDIGTLLQRVEDEVYKHGTLSISPNFYAYVLSGGNHAALIGDMLGMAINQNTGKWHLGASAAEIELCVVRWIAEFTGFPVDTAGVIVSGGSSANLTCLKAARDFKAPFDIRTKGIRGGPQMTMYVSTEGHSCLDKSADMTGIGREFLRKIPVKDDFTIDLGLLEQKILDDKAAGLLPICVIGNGGTVNTGAVDPLDALADLAARHNLWFHIDGAYGGPAAGTALAGGMFKGLERADSIATDAHKWFYVQFEAGVALVRNRKALQSAFSVIPDYLRSNDVETGRYDVTEYNFQLSRNFKALKVWMTFKAYGTDALRTAIQNNIRTMQYLASLVDSANDFERLAPAPLSIVCFRYRTEEKQFRDDDEYLSLLNKNILVEAERDGRVFITGTILRGKHVLRACSVNHRTESRHVEYLLMVMREIGKRCHAALQEEKTQ